MPIRLLDPKTIAQIAAGEVVERPASVVKELVENALDAETTQVVVEVRGGGVGFIRVIDNGRGIPSDELELAFQRHATSKLTSIDDLDCLDTLGFRGEALPSIAVVGEVEVSTSTGEGGDLLSLKNGEIVGRTGQARPRGTTVTVRNLFRNVPARLKFLKSNATENGHLAGIVTQYALARPDVKFTLLIDGRGALQSSGTGRLLDTVVAVYGVEVAQKMVAIGTPDSAWQAGEHHDIRVTGMVSSPLLSRAGRDALSFFVNRRAINNRSLTFAVEEAYQGLLMQDRHPIAVVNIEIPPGQVDVNVHPTKSEVKFQDERAVFGAVQRSVREALVRLAPIPGISEATPSYRGSTTPTQPLPWTVPPPSENRSAGTAQRAGQDIGPPTPEHRLPPLRIVGQVGSTYLVAEGPDGMYVIDQHAAHERVLYEKIRAEKAAKRLEVQGLLEPATLQATPREDAVMQESIEALRELGFDIEPFGERSYLVRAVPAVLAKADFLSAVREFLDDPTKRDRERSEAIIKTVACHGAVRAGKTLTDDEMRELVRLLEQTIDPFHCPHGRPTLIHIGVRQLEHEFGRA